MQQFEVPIIQKSYELYQDLYKLHRTIPKPDRYTLWENSENTLLKILKGFIRTGYLPQEAKYAQLTEASVRLDILRIFLRLSLDVKAVPQNKYVLLQQKMNEIGRMLGGWLRSMKPK